MICVSPRTLSTVAALALVVAACGQPLDEGRLDSVLTRSAGCGRAALSTDGDGRIEGRLVSSGGPRDYLVVVPPDYSPEEPVPVVFMFHGAGSNREQQLEYSGFGPVAAAGGALLVLPDALGEPPHWSPFGPAAYGVEGVDDIAFFDDLLRRLGQDFCIDPSRLLAAGLSSGGFMAASLGCQRSGKIRAVGAVAATMWTAEKCDGAAPVSYTNFHGTADAVVPYDGSLGTGGLSSGPIEDSAAAWAAQNRCDPEPVDELVSPEPVDELVGTRVVRRSWSGCDAATTLYIVEGGGHTWPGADVESTVGLTTQDVDASHLIWDAFEATWTDG